MVSILILPFYPIVYLCSVWLLLTQGTLLLQHRQIKTLPRTPEQDHKNVFRWIWSEKPVEEGEYDWIYPVEDFVSLVPPQRKPHNLFEAFVRAHIDTRPLSWLKVSFWPPCYVKAIFSSVFRSFSNLRITPNGQMPQFISLGRGA
jgi:hypothetical protein